jgi:hypothetical protein
VCNLAALMVTTNDYCQIIPSKSVQIAYTFFSGTPYSSAF